MDSPLNPAQISSIQLSLDMKPAFFLRALLALVTTLSTAFSQTTATPPGYEKPPVRAASDLLQAAELRGPSYRVREKVLTDGYIAHFTIDSDFGTFEDIKAFQRNPALSTTRRHQIVLALGALPAAAGRGQVVQLANSTTSPAQADFLVAATRMLAERKYSGAGNYTGLKVIGRLPAGFTASGEMHIPAPVDFVTWTEEVAGFVNRDDLGAMPKVIIHTGTASSAAVAGFAAAGWKAVPSPYPSH